MDASRIKLSSRMKDNDARGGRGDFRRPAPGAALEKRRVLAVAAVAALLLAMAPGGRAASADFEPATLVKQRATLCLKASGTPLAELENEVNHLAVLSETCRAEYGAKACGLADKPLDSDKLDERYAYYIRRPVDARLSGHQIKIDRHKWETPSAPASH